MIKNRLKKYIILVWAVLFAVSLLSVPTAAEEPCRIVLSAEYENKPVVGLPLELYLCAKWQETGLAFVGDFSDYPLAEIPETADAWQTLAIDFEGFISAKGISPDAEGSIDENGIVPFDSLEPGLYFIPGAVLRVEDAIYTSAPFFVFVTDGEPTVEAKIKLSYEDIPKTEIRKVIKIWNDDRYEDQRPESITVALYADGAEYARVELNKENNWSYTWELPDGKKWTLHEETPDGYRSSVGFEGITFTITNTPIIPPKPPAPPSPPILPQTGLVWWPILILFGLAIVSFILAYQFRRVEKNEKK